MTDKPWKRRVTVVALAVFAMLLGGNTAQGSDIEPDRRRQPERGTGRQLPVRRGLLGRKNVWAVGAVYPPTGGNFRGLALRYDGTAWRSVPRTGLPGNEGLRGVDAVSATDVWAVGDRRAGISGYDTLVAHWNGTAWTRESTPNANPGGINNLYGVAAAGGTVWAVGTYVDPNSSINRRKLILQRAGGSWRVSAAPTVATYERLAAVDATGSADAWAVGSASSDIQSAPLVTARLALERHQLGFDDAAGPGRHRVEPGWTRVRPATCGRSGRPRTADGDAAVCRALRRHFLASRGHAGHRRGR